MSDHAETAGRLEAEAQTILESTGLLELFRSRFGTAVLTGSALYGLMVWPDIDIHMPVAAEARLDWSGLLRNIAERLESGGCRLHKAEYLDDYVDPHPLGAGLYWALRFRDPGGERMEVRHLGLGPA